MSDAREAIQKAMDEDLEFEVAAQPRVVPLPRGGALYRTGFLLSGTGRSSATVLTFRRHREALAADARERLLPCLPDGGPGEER
jgi:hypothetical protein